jgi:hypothetical protein
MSFLPTNLIPHDDSARDGNGCSVMGGHLTSAIPCLRGSSTVD